MPAPGSRNEYRGTGTAPARGNGPGQRDVRLAAAWTFGTRDLVPVGYAAFAFALGATVGLLVRRTLPAIAITLAVFAAVQVAVPFWVRPHLFPAVRTVSTVSPSAITGVGSLWASGDNGWGVTASANIPGAWVYSSQVTLRGGTPLGPMPQPCSSGAWNACVDMVAKLHPRQVVTYQPASRYWAFQWTETGMYLLLALLLTGFCIWQVNRRLSR